MPHDLFISYAHQGDNTSREAVAALVARLLPGPEIHPGSCSKNPAEFFAVATECFFEKPRPLREKHPELYDELKRFYQQDPAEWCVEKAE